MRHQGQFGSQKLNFFMHGFVFVHDKQFPALNGAKAASDFDSGNLEVLFGNGNLHAFRQVYELLIQLIRFHDYKVPQPLEIRTLCVIIISHFIPVYDPRITPIAQIKYGN